MNVKDELIDRLIDLSFAEDIGDGDHTTLSTIPADAMGKNMLLIKEDGVLAGVEMAKRIFARFDEALQVEVLIEDGAEVKKGDIADTTSATLTFTIESGVTLQALFEAE
jgi:nicotinate-nucleotide pyrophosphorylase (carboxylating)